MKYNLLIGLIITIIFFVLFFQGESKAAAALTPTPGRTNCYTATSTAGGQRCVCYDGLVPCGKEVDIYQGRCGPNGNPTTSIVYSISTVYCTLCHFFIMLNEIINFVVLKLVPPIAVMMIVYAGILFYFGGSNPQKIKSAQNIIKDVAIGLFFIYGSFMIVSTVLGVLGVLDWANPLTSGKVIQINCVPEIP